MDTCPKCGALLEYEEADIGIGILRGNPGCPECFWTPTENPREKGDDDGVEYGHPDDYRKGFD